MTAPAISPEVTVDEMPDVDGDLGCEFPDCDSLAALRIIWHGCRDLDDDQCRTFPFLSCAQCYDVLVMRLGNELSRGIHTCACGKRLQMSDVILSVHPLY